VRKGDLGVKSLQLDEYISTRVRKVKAIKLTTTNLDIVKKALLGVDEHMEFSSEYDKNKVLEFLRIYHHEDHPAVLEVGEWLVLTNDREEFHILSDKLFNSRYDKVGD